MFDRRAALPDILRGMDLTFSHITALVLLRIWSCNHPLTLRAFHDLRPRDAGHLPFRHLREPRPIVGSADTEAAVRMAVENVKKPSMRHTLDKLWDEASEKNPLHVLVGPKRGRHSTQRILFHQISAPLPSHALLEIAPGIAVCSPEMVFVQMAEALSVAELIALGYELCGCYPLDTERSEALVRAPLTTPARLSAFVDRADRVRGVRKARIAVRYVRAKSASPKETEMDALLLTPQKWGGMGFPEALVNEPVSLSSQAARILRGNRVVCDLLWPQYSLAAEYDGREAHLSRHQQTRDSRRRDALLANGTDVVTITSPQIDGVSDFLEVADAISRKMKRRPLKRTETFWERHLQLRHGIRSYHCNYLSRPSRRDDAMPDGPAPR